MRKVGGKDDQRLRPAPQPLDHLGDFFDARRAHGKWRDGEIAELLLQERQLHLERMFEGMRGVAHHDLRQGAHRVERLAIDGHHAKRRGERARGGKSEPAHRHTVHRPENNHTPHDAARGRELIVGARGHGAGIDIAGMRHDQRFRESEPRRRFACAGEEIIDLGGERPRLGRVKHAGDGGIAYGSHGSIYWRS